MKSIEERAKLTQRSGWHVSERKVHIKQDPGTKVQDNKVEGRLWVKEQRIQGPVSWRLTTVK